MPAYMITRSDVESLDAVIFAAGPHDNEEAVAIFTDPASAEAYIQNAGWASEYTVAAVEPIPLLRWLLQLHDEGVHHIAVDPTYADQEAGQKLSTLSVQGQLEHAGSHIMQVARPDF